MFAAVLIIQAGSIFVHFLQKEMEKQVKKRP